MAIMASDSGGGDYQPVPQGTYDAICYKIVDAGTSMNKFQDEVNKQHSIFIFWELPTCRTEDDRPMSIFHKYRLSLRETAKLRSHLQSWRNKPFTEKELAGFDITKILGVTCKLTVGLTSGGKEKVTGVFCADGGPKKTATENEQVIFDLEDYMKEFSGESCEASKKACDIFEGLPSFMQWQIAGCDEPGKEQIPPCFEMQAALAKGGEEPKKEEVVVEDDFEDDIPF